MLEPNFEEADGLGMRVVDIEQLSNSEPFTVTNLPVYFINS